MMTAPARQRLGLFLAGLALALIGCVPPFAPAQAVLFPTASLLIGWAIKAPGHEGP
jgi:hypothetical protein